MAVAVVDALRSWNYKCCGLMMTFCVVQATNNPSEPRGQFVAEIWAPEQKKSQEVLLGE